MTLFSRCSLTHPSGCISPLISHTLNCRIVCAAMLSPLPSEPIRSPHCSPACFSRKFYSPLGCAEVVPHEDRTCYFILLTLPRSLDASPIGIFYLYSLSPIFYRIFLKNDPLPTPLVRRTNPLFLIPPRLSFPRTLRVFAGNLERSLPTFAQAFAVFLITWRARTTSEKAWKPKRLYYSKFVV